MTRLEKKYIKVMAPTGIVNMIPHRELNPGSLHHWYPLYQVGFVDILCAQALSNSDIHGNQNVLQRNGPVLTPTVLALMPGKSHMPFCKAGAKLAWINAYFFLQFVFCHLYFVASSLPFMLTSSFHPWLLCLTVLLHVCCFCMVFPLCAMVTLVSIVILLPVPCLTIMYVGAIIQFLSSLISSTIFFPVPHNAHKNL